MHGAASYGNARAPSVDCCIPPSEQENDPSLSLLSKTSGLNPAGVTSAASPAVAQAPRDRGLAAQLDETQRFRLTAPSVGCDSAWAVGLGA